MFTAAVEGLSIPRIARFSGSPTPHFSQGDRPLGARHLLSNFLRKSIDGTAVTDDRVIRSNSTTEVQVCSTINMSFQT